MYKQVRNIVLLITAVGLVLVGLVTFLLPIPLGIVPLIIGMAMLMIVSPTVRRWFHRLRNRYPVINKSIVSIEPHLPTILQKVLRTDKAG